MNKTNKIIIGVIVVLIVVWGIWYGVYKKPTTITERTAKIGVIMPFSGKNAAYGQAVREGLDIASEEIKNDNEFPVKIELIYEDNASEVQNSVSAVQKLINIDNVIAFIAGVSQHSMAVAPIAEENKIVLYAMASQTTKLNNAGDYVFKNDDDAFSLGKGAAQLIFNLGYRKAGVLFALYNDTTVDTNESFQQEFKKLGGEVVATEGFSNNEKDFRTYLSKIKSKNPEVILLAALQGDDVSILNQIKELGIKAKIFSNGSVEDPQVIKGVGEAAEGIIFITFQGYPSEAFVKKTQEKYGHSPLRWSAEAYDGLKILATALAKIKGDKITSDLLKENLSQIKSYQGDSGEIKFDELGNAKRELFIKIIKNGQFVPYEK